MSEATFNLKDLIMIIGALVSGVGFYWKIVVNNKEMKGQINQLQKDVDKNEAVMFKKFTGIHTRMEKNESEVKSEFTLLNKELNDIKVGMASMDGKLTTIINNMSK